MSRFVGIDVGAQKLHCVVLGEDKNVLDSVILDAGELRSLVAWTQRADVVAIDAPAQLSTAPHSEDPALTPKFRPARCAEIALGRDHGVWVPWIAPLERPETGWMAVGLRIFEVLGDAGHAPIEVFPYGGYVALAGGVKPPPKSSPAGKESRIRLLELSGIGRARIAAWGHDRLDALLAALIAQQFADGQAVRVGCGHDDSAIWQPGPEQGRERESSSAIVGG